jgi:hypothetical protein
VPLVATHIVLSVGASALAHRTCDRGQTGIRVSELDEVLDVRAEWPLAFGLSLRKRAEGGNSESEGTVHRRPDGGVRRMRGTGAKRPHSFPRHHIQIYEEERGCPGRHRVMRGSDIKAREGHETGCAWEEAQEEGIRKRRSIGESSAGLGHNKDREYWNIPKYGEEKSRVNRQELPMGGLSFARRFLG